MLPQKPLTSSRARWVTGVMLVALLGAACGGNHSNGAAPSGGTTAAPNSTAPAAARFGTLPSPCGPGTATGATDKGVTDSSITIGFGDDAGYASAPGLDKELSDAIRAMITWCNAAGGINGRKVIGKYYDAKVLEIAQVMTQACNDKVFMLVGQGWVLDSSQEQIRIGCKLATIPGYSVSSVFAHGSGMEQPLPNPGDEMTDSAAFEVAKLFPDAVKKAALVFAKYPPTQETRDKEAAAYPKAGWKFMNCDQVYGIQGESDWKPLASNLKACGAEVVDWIGSPDPNLEGLLNAAKQVGFEPKAWVTDPNQYTASFAKWNGQNGGAGDNVYVRMTGVPFEFADQVPAVKQYMSLLAQSKGTIGLLGEQAASSFLLWATGVKACGSAVTAKCVLDSAATQKNWTGGGLHIPTDPGANDASKCGMLLKLDGAKWVKVVPSGNQLFDCNAKYLITGLSTAAVTAAKLNASRVATAFGTFTPN